MSIDKRLRTLEDSSRTGSLPGASCRGCGYTSGAGPVCFEINEAGIPTAKKCPECEWVLAFTLDIGRGDTT